MWYQKEKLNESYHICLLILCSTHNNWAMFYLQIQNVVFLIVYTCSTIFVYFYIIFFHFVFDLGKQFFLIKSSIRVIVYLDPLFRYVLLQQQDLNIYELYTWKRKSSMYCWISHLYKQCICNYEFEPHQRPRCFLEQETLLNCLVLVGSRNGFEPDLHKPKIACFTIELK